MTIIANLLVQNIRRTHPLLWILATNLIPIAGVFYADWSAYEVIMMYWFETIVIGFFAFVKFLIPNSEDNFFLRLGLAIFFCIHFGLFCAIQGLFIFIGLKNDHINHTEGLTYGAIALAGNYLLHFLNDHIMSGKYKSKEPISFFAPYGRVVVQQFVILLGGFFSVRNNHDHNTAMLLLLISLKTLVDFVIYLLNRDSKEESAWKIRYNI